MAHACDNEDILSDHGTRLAKIEDRINRGDIEFAKISKDIETLSGKVGTLTEVLKWVGSAIGLGLLGTAGSALLWTVRHMNP